MTKILVIEDDKAICEALINLLKSNNYEALTLESYEDIISNALKIKPDLILLDINLPEIDGQNVLKELREKTNIPVIMVTSLNNETDEALSIAYGADDYITKPYNPNILLLRIGAVLKRINRENNILAYKDLTVNIQKGLITRNNKEIVLTKNEMIIFYYLLVHQNRIVTRDELMTDLWDNNEFINDNALTVNISRLRTKLKELGYKNIIETRKGQGYILS